MRTADVLFVEVDKKENLPETLEVGVLYFVMNDGLITVNHGVKIVEYPAANSTDFGDFKGVWPVSKGGTGGTTPELARSSLGAMGFNDNAASATKLVTAFEVKLEGDVTGAALVDGSGDVILTTSLAAIGTNAFERIANKTAVIQNAAFADDIKYPTERAVRLELDAKADKSEIGGAFKGVFQNGTELVTAYPVGQLGWNATVLNTNTTWIWNGAAWADSGSLQAAAVQTVNGVSGPDVVLDIETNLNGYNKASIDTKVNTLNTAIGTKQDALTQAQLDTLNSVAGASTTDPLIKQSDVTNVQNSLQTNIDTVQSTLETADTALDTKIDNAVTSLTNMVDGTALYTLTGNQLTNALGGTVALDVSLFPAGAELDVNRTLVTDEAGFMGVVVDTDTVPGQVTVKTVVTHSDNGGHIPVLLDNVQSYYDMPLLMSDATAMFSRTPVVDDYVRVVSDERHSGATVEYRVTSTNTPVTVLLGVRENLVGNDPASLIPTVTAALAQGFIAPIVGDRYGLYTTTTPRTWTRYFVTAVDGDNITWGDAQVWDFKDGDDIPADFTVRPDLGWGSPLIINTSQYQAQTPISMNGRYLTGGPVVGTFGASKTAKDIVTESGIIQTPNIMYNNTVFEDFMRGFTNPPSRSVFDGIYYDGPAHGKGTNAFAGGVLTPQGKVILVPASSANIGIYDPATNTYTDGPVHGKGTNAFIGGVLTPQGKVILVPASSANIGIYDPVANTYTDGPDNSAGRYYGGVLTPQGKVIFVPRDSANVGIYDPVANTYTDGPVHGKGTNAFIGGVLTPQGKVILVPASSANIGIYDPATNTYTDGPAHGKGSLAFWGGVLTPQGKVILVPRYSANIGIYDPIANTYTDGPAHGKGTNVFGCGVLTPQGKVILVPASSANIGIYDPIANTYTDGPASSGSFQCGVLIPQGRIIMVPDHSSVIGIYNLMGATTELGYCLHPYLNKF